MPKPAYTSLNELSARKVVDDLNQLFTAYQDNGSYGGFFWSYHHRATDQYKLMLETIMVDKKPFKLARVFRTIGDIHTQLVYKNSRTLLPQLTQYLKGIFTCFPQLDNDPALNRVYDLNRQIKTKLVLSSNILIEDELKDIIDKTARGLLSSASYCYESQVDKRDGLHKTQLDAPRLHLGQTGNKDDLFAGISESFKSELEPLINTDNILCKRIKKIIAAIKSEYQVEIGSISAAYHAEKPSADQITIHEQYHVTKARIPFIDYETLRFKEPCLINERFTLQHRPHLNSIYQSFDSQQYSSYSPRRTSVLPAPVADETPSSPRLKMAS